MQIPTGVRWCLATLLLVGCSDDAAMQMMSPVGPTAGMLPLPAAGSTAIMGAAGSGAAVPTGTAGTGTAAAAGTGSSAAAGTSAVAGTSAAAGTGAAGMSAAAGTDAPGTTAGTGVAAEAGTGGAAGAAGGAAAGSGGTAGSMASTFKRPCIAAGKEVIFIGDSYSDYAIAHPPLAGLIADRAKMAMALKQSDSYQNLAVAGTTLAAPPADIQRQWNDVKSMKPIKVVVMDGGGNDVLINNTQCRPDGAEKQADCMQVVQDSLDAAKMMFASMKDAGVSDVLYFWYPHIPGGALTGFETGSTISDYTYPMLVDLAKAASTDTFHVFTVPTVDIFTGHPEYFYTDGLHANDTGEGKIADAVWGVMKDNCIGQAEASGCCMP